MKLSFDLQLDRKGFSLRARAEVSGRVTGLLGPSGAGKSTILHAICGLERDIRGRVELDGRVLLDTDSRTFVPPHRRRLGVCFQDDRLLEHISVKRNLLYGCKLTPPAQRRLGLADVVDLLRIGHLLSARPGDLSGGERQRVALGRALLTSPRLLLLDEPLAAMDVNLRRRILPFLRRVRDACDIPMILVSHDLGEILELTENLMVVRDGRLVANGSLLDLARDPDVLPLLHEMGIRNVLRLEVTRHDRAEGVTTCRLMGARPPAAGGSGDIHLPLTEAPEGTTVHAWLGARDIALALLPASDISIRNQLPGRVADIVSGRGRCVCVVELSEQTILVEVTLRAVHELSLAPGKRVWCLFKSHTLRVLQD